MSWTLNFNSTIVGLGVHRTTPTARTSPNFNSTIVGLGARTAALSGWNYTFQFNYCKIGRATPSVGCCGNTNFNSTIVRLGVRGAGLLRHAAKHFNSTIVRLGEHILLRFGVLLPFQFNYCKIGRVFTSEPSPAPSYFNSTIVRLGALLYHSQTTSRIDFNSTIVTLGAERVRRDVGLLSYFNSTIVRLGALAADAEQVTVRFQFNYCKIGRCLYFKAASLYQISIQLL